MITIKNFELVLQLLDFVKNGNTYIKNFSQYNCSLNMYLEAFKTDSTTIKYQSSKTFKKLSTTEQARQLAIKFYEYAKHQEFEKLLYFALTYTQQTVIITAPTDNAKQKEFLGYDWSKTKTPTVWLVFLFWVVL